MTITKLILSGYKRLFLNTIEVLEFTPVNIVNIILGANGSGKSSLLYMLNPLPADLKKDFKEDGYKYIEIDHHNKKYILSSGMITKNKHSFKCDDIEYNEGGTRKVQLELVREHFNITNDINNILIGNVNFSSMGLQERKYWFSELSTIDYKFPISVYNSLKQRERDILGGIKLSQEQLIKAETNILSQEGLDKLITDSVMLEKYIDHCVSLYDHSVAVHGTSHTLESIREANTTVRYIMKNLNTNESLEDIRNKIHYFTEYEKTLKDKLITINNDIHTLEDSYCPIDNLKEAEDAKKDYLDKLDELKNNMFIAIPLNTIESVITSYNFIINDVLGCFNQLSDYSSYDSSKDNIELLMIKRTNLARELKVILTEITILTAEQNMIIKSKQEDNLVKCGNCNHEWYLGYDENKLNSILKRLKKIEEDKEIKEKESLILEELYTSIVAKAEIINNIKHLISSNTYLKEIWSYVFNRHNIHKDSPSVFVSDLNKISGMLEQCKEYSNFEKHLWELEKNILLLRDVNKAKDDVISIRVATLEKELISITTKLTQNSNDLRAYSTILILKEKLYTTRKDLVTMIRKYRKEIENEIIIERNKTLSELVTHLKSELVGILQTINTSKQLVRDTEMVKKRLEEYKLRDKVLSHLLKALSPSEGIIAKSINSFLNVFITEMNHIINSVWSYSMILLPCEVTEENDLDYKFRVRVNNTDTIEDISKLSTSMQEIVNLAFKIVFVKYLKIADTPLFLDEFGRTMDPAHRISAYNVVDRILSSNFSQIFIVSHFESMYGRFANADISVLDPKNLELNPDVSYNTVLKINHSKR